MGNNVPKEVWDTPILAGSDDDRYRGFVGLLCAQIVVFARLTRIEWQKLAKSYIYCESAMSAFCITIRSH